MNIDKLLQIGPGRINTGKNIFHSAVKGIHVGQIEFRRVCRKGETVYFIT